MKKRPNTIVIAISLLLVLSLCGGAFAVNTPKMDLAANPVYIRCDDTTFPNHLNQRIVCHGEVLQVEERGRDITIQVGASRIRVTNGQRNETGALTEGAGVTVYGQLRKGAGRSGEIEIAADHLMQENRTLTDDRYVYGGASYRDQDSTEITLAENRIRLHIPNSWRAGEVPADGYEEIFNHTIWQDDTGRCYYLNSIHGLREPEVCAVFFFNNNKFLDRSGDASRVYEIEKAIIQNICPKEKFSILDPTKWVFPSETSNSNNGRIFDHYVANYDNYRIEFAFTQVRDGMCVLLHMYNDDAIRADDILYVMDSMPAE
ncbi:MAG: hypothetical protein IJT34_03055 [Butyrivibrio sp.]|nr:hypothetical protein [Butyrivibrio sp.]